MITIKDCTLRRGDKVVLEGANATIFMGEKLGLVGKNGAGKSSLFSLLTGRLHEEAGSVSVPTAALIAEVAQDMPEGTQSATDFVIAGDIRLMRARQALEQVHRLAEVHNDWSEVGEAHTDLASAGEYTAKARAQTLLLGLGFMPHELDNPINAFSGGWRMRLQLARTLISSADILLLDEPTNHLDLDALVWLENYLRSFAGTLIVISHDREFLDAMCQSILHIENATITRYGGNYGAFETTCALRLSHQSAQFAQQKKQRAHLQSFIDRFRAKASKAKQVQSRIKAMERLETIAPLVGEADFSFSFRESAKLPNPLLSVVEGEFGYTGDDHSPDRIIINTLNQTLLSGARIGLLGANGQGKSTWIKTIAGMQPLISGRLVRASGLKIGYFAQQEMDILHADKSALHHLQELIKSLDQSVREVELRSFLGSFNFVGDAVHQSVGSMSGGEKARLALAMIVWQAPNLLLLDEPTNHLDIPTREALSMAMNEFEGTVIVVSHDRALLRAVCDEFWLIADKKIVSFDGDMEDYQRYLLEQSKRVRSHWQATLQAEKGNSSVPLKSASAMESPPTNNPPSPPSARTHQTPKLSSSQRRSLEKKCLALEEKIKEGERDLARLALIPLHTLSTNERTAHLEEQHTLTHTIQEWEQQWFAEQEKLLD